MSDASTTPLVSVIMPVHNGAAYLGRTIPAIRASDLRDFELIVVNDASNDSTRELLQRFPPDVLIENARRLGPFAARNLAVERARGQILFFTDADVVLSPNTLSTIVRQLPEADSGALIGLYRAPDADDDPWTFYKTAWVRFSYLSAPEQVTWFFTAVGGLRRAAWDKCGPFRPEFSLKTGGGDIDYGRRLLACGATIRLDKTLEVQHLKRFTLLSLLKNDFFRSFGYCRLALRARRLKAAATGAPTRGIANIGTSFVAGVVAAAMMLVAILLRRPVLFAFAGAAWWAANRRFFAYVFEIAPLSTAIPSVVIAWVDQLACAAGVAAAVGRELAASLRRKAG